MDLARTETADVELVRIIERRSRKGEIDPNEREELWKESVRRYTPAVGKPTASPGATTSSASRPV